MALSVTFNVPLNIAVQGGPATIPVVVGVSLGEPKIVTHESKPQFDPQIRNCDQCGHQFRETRLWSQFPQCGDCQRREQARRDREYAEYLRRQDEIREMRHIAQEEDRAIITAAQQPRDRGFNEINGIVNWIEQGF